MKCKHCGTTNDGAAQFCVECGKSLKHSKSVVGRSRRLEAQPLRQSYRKYKWHAVIGMISLFVAAWLMVGGAEDPRTGVIEPLDLEVAGIASQFYCSCGECAGEELSRCSCDAAKKEREFIRAALASGTSHEAINGVLSAKHRSKVSAGDVKNTRDRGPQRLAVQTDMTEILENYRCGCGKCEGEPLSECDCGHENGGLDVKAYLGTRLADTTISRQDLMRELERKFALQRVM